MKGMQATAGEAAARADRIVVLFRPDLGRRVRELAERERRPLTAQIQVLVERALALEIAAA